MPSSRNSDDVWIVGEVDMSDRDGRRVKARRPDGETKGGRNRRCFERAELSRDAVIMELDEFGHPGATWACRLADISRGGIGVRSRRMVHDGRHVFVIVQTSEGGARKVLGGVVRQCRYLSGEGYAIGIQFRAPPPTPQVKTWIANHGQASRLAADPGAD